QTARTETTRRTSRDRARDHDVERRQEREPVLLPLREEGSEGVDRRSSRDTARLLGTGYREDRMGRCRAESDAARGTARAGHVSPGSPRRFKSGVLLIGCAVARAA